MSKPRICSVVFKAGFCGLRRCRNLATPGPFSLRALCVYHRAKAMRKRVSREPKK